MFFGDFHAEINQKGRNRKSKKLKKELESLNYRIENLQDLLVDGTISPKTYGAHRSEVTLFWGRFGCF